MSKMQRFLIVVAIIAVAFAFLWPTVSWYWLTPKADQALALGTREQIRDYSRNMAIADIKELESRAAAGDESVLDPERFRAAITVSTKAYTTAKKKAPKEWTAASVLKPFTSEKAAYEAIEGLYRSKVLATKAKLKKAVKLGLDLSGGMSALIQVDMKSLAAKLGHQLSASERADAMARAIESLNSRINKFGLTEPTIRQQGDEFIYIEIPGAADPEKINEILMGRGKLAFHLVNQEATSALRAYLYSNPLGVDEKTMTVEDKSIVPEGYVIRKLYEKDAYGLDEFTGEYYVINEQPSLDGNHITQATTSFDEIGRPETLFQLDSEGGKIFYEMTSAHVGDSMVVVLDDRIKSSPATINEPIREGVRITGFSADEARNLALILRSAALPVEMTPISTQAVGSTIGEDAVREGVFAVSLAFILVLSFMLVFYKGAGVNAAIAQLVNLYLMISILSAFNLTLTLPSIAGFVLTIGMSVDANVLVFERMKEELRLGKGRAAAVEAGFDKAFWTIMDSNITTIIAALLLGMLGSGPIQGFAIALAIGCISSVFTALFVSHLIFDFETDVLKSKYVSISWRVK